MTAAEVNNSPQDADGFFTRSYNRDPQVAAPSDELINAAQCAAHGADTYQKARDAFQRYSPLLAEHSPDVRLFTACATMLEKQRKRDGMLRAWADLQALFPTDPYILRMLMRWYRRGNLVEEGLRRLMEVVPDATSDAAQANLRLLGYIELNAHTEIDRMMAESRVRAPENRTLKVRYVQALTQQLRYREAAQVARTIENTDRLGPAARAMLDEAVERSRILANDSVSNAAAALGDMAAHFADRRPRELDKTALGPIALITGQLGGGGAERQMTRIAVALQKAWSMGMPCFGGHQLAAPPQVCVRHTNPATGADFFLPTLTDAGVATYVLDDQARASSDVMGPLRELLPLLPQDLATNTLKLVAYFRNLRPDVAYLWQDGGVTTAAVAALVAGVPRVVASFRGLPPNLRPELMRAQMPHLYKVLYRIPGVSFTANSRMTASAYEEWLGFEPGTIQVVLNAVPEPSGEGSAEDIALWRAIEKSSPLCSKTVLGVFRFDHNKRPELWVRTAIRHASRDSSTRFVVLGTGFEHGRCREIVQDAGLQNRIFLPGTTRHVGYYLARSDLVMHLARHEGLPNVLIEAQLAARPILATPAGGTVELMATGESGWLLPDSNNPDPDEILAALELALADTARLREMGKAAQARSRDRFDPDRILANTLDLFVATGSQERRECVLS